LGEEKVISVVLTSVVLISVFTRSVVAKNKKNKKVKII
jgi:hypothetical protein